MPEFIGFATFDDIPSAYCDSNGRAEPQQEWARRLSQQDPQHLKTYIQECERHKYVLSGYMKDLNQQMNQTEGQSSCLYVFFCSKNLDKMGLITQTLIVILITNTNINLLYDLRVHWS